MSFLVDLLFPPKCASCRSLLAPELYGCQDLALCEDCMKKWNSECLETCGICAKKVNECFCVTEEMQKAKCKAFGKAVFYYGNHHGAVQNNLIFSLKERGARRNLRFAANALLPVLQRMILDVSDFAKENAVFTYLPRTHRAKLAYGTDQAEELARALSQSSGIPVMRLVRRRWLIGKEQKRLSPAERTKNAQKSLVAVKHADCQGKTVIVVDDIVTTGAGMAACARLLRSMGAREVLCLSLASDSVNRDKPIPDTRKNTPF